MRTEQKNANRNRAMSQPKDSIGIPVYFLWEAYVRQPVSFLKLAVQPSTACSVTPLCKSIPGVRARAHFDRHAATTGWIDAIKSGVNLIVVIV